MLSKTGTEKGSAAGDPTEKKLSRSLLRQYKAADAIAYHGYSVQNNPALAEADHLKGIARSANPDFRIEGEIFDCYTPDPPFVIQANVQQEQFSLSDDISGDPYNDTWITDSVAATITSETNARILDGIRTHVGQKIHARQAFSFVVNITDVARRVSSRDVVEMFRVRGLERLEHLFIVAPKSGMPPARARAGVETITGRVSTFEQSTPYHYDLYEPHQLTVTYASHL